MTDQRHLKRPLSIGPDKVSTTLTLVTLVHLRAGQTCVLSAQEQAPELISRHPAFLSLLPRLSEGEESLAGKHASVRNSSGLCV